MSSPTKEPNATGITKMRRNASAYIDSEPRFDSASINLTSLGPPAPQLRSDYVIKPTIRYTSHLERNVALTMVRRPLDPVANARSITALGKVRETGRWPRTPLRARRFRLAPRQSHCCLRASRTMLADCSTIRNRSLDKSGVVEALSFSMFCPAVRRSPSDVGRHSAGSLKVHFHPMDLSVRLRIISS